MGKTRKQGFVVEKGGVRFSAPRFLSFLFLKNPSPKRKGHWDGDDDGDENPSSQDLTMASKDDVENSHVIPEWPHVILGLSQNDESQNDMEANPGITWSSS